MAIISKVRPTVVRRKPEPVQEDDIEDEVDGEEEDVEEEDEVEEEPVKPAKKKVAPPAPTAKTTAKARPVVEEDEEEDEVEEEEVKPKKRVVPPPPPAKASKKVVEEPANAPKIKTVATTVVDNVLPGLIEALGNGKAIIITRISDDKWQIIQGTGQILSQKMSPREYEQTVHTSEYLEWVVDWKTKTAAEKVQFAKSNKIQYPKHSDPRVEAIGLAESVMEHLGIEKYKPGYERPSVRRALKGK